MDMMRGCECAAALLAGVIIGGIIVFKSKTVRDMLKSKEKAIMATIDDAREEIADKIEPKKTTKK